MIALLYFTMAFAEPTVEYCQPAVSSKIERRFPVPGNVNYFMRPAVTTQQVGFATKDGNMLMNLIDGKIEKAPGLVDPVPSPDGKILAVPYMLVYEPGKKGPREWRSGDSSRIEYLIRGNQVLKMSVEGSPEDLKNHFQKDGPSGRTDGEFRYESVPGLTVPKFLKMKRPYMSGAMTFHAPKSSGGFSMAGWDHSIQDNYQSLGVLRSNQTGGAYRMIFESSGGVVKFRDYSFAAKARKVSPIGKIKPLCGGEGMRLSTPMLSKDGTEFSGYSVDDERTQVYGVDSAGNCHLKEDIPALLGKMDFSPDGRRLAFHLDQAAETSHEIFANPNDKNRLGVFIYDRMAKRMIPVHDVPNENAYYPVWISNDALAFVSVTKDRGAEKKFFVNVVKITEEAGLPCAGCSDSNREGQLAALLGHIYNLKCGQESATYRHALSGFSKLSPKNCDRLMTEVTDEFVAEAVGKANGKPWNREWLAVKKDDLLRYCGSSEAPQPGSAPTTK